MNEITKVNNDSMVAIFGEDYGKVNSFMDTVDYVKLPKIEILKEVAMYKFNEDDSDVAKEFTGSLIGKTTGRAHWELLLRARAVENQCYVLASAQGGVHPSGRRTWGDSMLIDPWGQVINRLARGPGVVVGDMNEDYLVEVRQNLPALGHRRLSC